MTVLLLIAAYTAMALAAFVSAWIVFREFLPAAKTAALSAVAFFVLLCTWLGLSEPRADIDDTTLMLIVIGAGFLAYAFLIRRFVRPVRGRPTPGEAAIVACISIAALAGSFAAGVSFLNARYGAG